MALLSQMMRNVAITGRTDNVNAWFADRQGKQWAERTVRRAFAGTRPHQAAPPPPPPPDPALTLQRLTELRDSGDITAAEFDRLRARTGA
jgi:hypothetical protein